MRWAWTSTNSHGQGTLEGQHRTRLPVTDLVRVRTTVSLEDSRIVGACGYLFSPENCCDSWFRMGCCVVFIGHFAGAGPTGVSLFQRRPAQC